MTAHLPGPQIVQPQEHLSSQALRQTLLPFLDMLHPIGAKSQICMGKLLGPFHDILCWSDGISSKPTQSPLLV